MPLRARVQPLSDTDRCLGRACGPWVASDPEGSHRSLGLGGGAFVVVGLHPGASRRARRFETPARVVDRHDQVERPRVSNVERTVFSAGAIDPMLAQPGERSAARQSCGSAVPEDRSGPYRRGTGGLSWEAQQSAEDLSNGAIGARQMDS